MAPSWISVHEVRRSDETDFSGSRLADKTTRRPLSVAIWPQTQSFDVSMRRGPILARIALDFADLHHDPFLTDAGSDRG